MEFYARSECNEWYTPSEYIEAARSLMGGIDLDPASCAEANEVVKASKYYTIEDDGLSREWFGRVWLNPPYGRIKCANCRRSSQGEWVGYLLDQWNSFDRVSEAVLLVNACTDARWFDRLWDFPICFVFGRIKFNSKTGRGNSPTKGSALVYLPPDDKSGSKFCEIFSVFGRCVLPGGG